MTRFMCPECGRTYLSDGERDPTCDECRALLEARDLAAERAETVDGVSRSRDGLERPVPSDVEPPEGGR